MKFNTLEKKSLSTDETKVIFARPTVVFINTTEVIAEHIVTEDQVGRMDLISLQYYRDANFVDYILKWNNISNPFAVNFGDVLEIPQNKAVLAVIKPIKMVQKSTNAISIRDQFIDTKRLPVKDAKRIEYLQRKAAQKANGSSQILPPNILKEGEVNLTIGNGTISI
jgi:alpha-L-arabinofuranosidase